MAHFINVFISMQFRRLLLVPQSLDSIIPTTHKNYAHSPLSGGVIQPVGIFPGSRHMTI